MNNSDWLDEPSQDTPEDEVIWSERRVCVDGKKPDNLHDYDLLRIILEDGRYSDDIYVCQVDWSACPEYQVLHQGAWNKNHGAAPGCFSENTFVRVILKNQDDPLNFGQIKHYWWRLDVPSSIAYYRVVSSERRSELHEEVGK